jgi:hypothetical protein
MVYARPTLGISLAAEIIRLLRTPSNTFSGDAPLTQSEAGNLVLAHKHYAWMRLGIHNKLFEYARS